MTPPKPFEPRPEASPLPPLARAAWASAIGVFELGSVVRRTEPHVRYLLLDSVRGSCLSLFSCVTSIFRCGFFVSHIKARKHGPVGRPAVPPSS